MEAISSFSDFNPVESVVDNMTKISEGRKSEAVADLKEVSSDVVSLDDPSMVEDVEEEDYDVEEDDSYDEESEDEEDFDDEEEEEDMERTRILEDMMKLKKMADFFQNPHKPVEVDGFSAGRSYFSRFDAPEVVSEDEDEELAQALADAQALKKSAQQFLQPHLPVEVDATASARGYFSQPWATPQETFGEAEARARNIEEAKQLGEEAKAWHHPEAPIAFPADAKGRNWFQRPGADQQDDHDMEDERAAVLADAQALKRIATDYLQPHLPVEVDAMASARAYPWTTEQEDEEVEDERALVLADAQALKKSATDYLQPHLPLVVDDTACARSWYSRPSAEEQIDEETDEERALILSEMKRLKSSAVDYMHPEQELAVDPASSGRSFFSRPAANHEDGELEAERQMILREASQLKKAAVDFMHPERPVEIASEWLGRNFFSRPAADHEDGDLDAERQMILKEAAQLKTQATMFQHPEAPLDVDPATLGRNYYSRPSAEDIEDMEAERQMILKEAAQLKKQATMFQHPEAPLDVDPASLGRNYYSRPSAEGTEDMEAERQMILKEAAQLKKQATMFQHPEAPLDADPATLGRNYYSRPSAEDTEDMEAERQMILKEAAQLKKQATMFQHPEAPLDVDPASLGRNYYSRPSAEDTEDMEAERQMILKEAAQLKKQATMFQHPEVPLDVDPATLGRNYYTRPSAEVEDDDLEAERQMILKEAAQLKEQAAMFHHPEAPLDVDGSACARNWFSRPSAPFEEASEETAGIMADMQALKQQAQAYLHPELSVTTSDPCARGRCFYSRPGAVGAGEEITTSGYANATQTTSEEQELNNDYGYYEMDEEMWTEMRQSIVLPLPSDSNVVIPKFQSSKMTSEEEGELSRSPSSVMLFTGALEDADHPPLPTMG